jgi:tetratricopeptide (TPR) repeat protein
MLMFCGFALMLPLAAVPTADGQTRTFTATGEYKMTPFDTKADAQRLAFLNARPRILDQAAAFLADVPGIKALHVSSDELRAYTGGLLDITERPARISEELAAVEASGSVDAGVATVQLERIVRDQSAKVGLMQSRDKLDQHQRDLASLAERLRAKRERDAEVRHLLDERQQTLLFIDTERQLARGWVTLAAPLSPADEHGGRQSAPGNAEEHRKRGVTLTQQGRYDEAIQEFRTALALMPTLIRSHLGLGAAFEGKQDYDAAMTEYRLVLAAHPDDPDAQNNLATVLQKKGDLEGALAAYGAAVRVAPDDSLIHFNYGTALAAKGEGSRAVAEYQRAVALRPDFAQAYMNLGLLLRDQGRADDAGRAFRRFLELAPKTPANQPAIHEASTFLREQERLKIPRGRMQPGP